MWTVKLAAFAMAFCSAQPAPDCAPPDPVMLAWRFVEAHRDEYKMAIVGTGWNTGAEALRVAKIMCQQEITGDSRVVHDDSEPVLFSEDTYENGHSGETFICRRKGDLIS